VRSVTKTPPSAYNKRGLNYNVHGDEKEFDVMDYVGIDPAVGLECSHCKYISRMPYSELLALVAETQQAECTDCERKMLHDWTTVAVVQGIIKKRMQQANEAKSRRLAQQG